MSELSQAGFSQVGVGAGKANRIWLEDDEQPKTQDPDSVTITNNQFYPE